MKSLERSKINEMVEVKRTVNIEGVDYMVNATVGGSRERRQAVNVYVKAASSAVAGAYVYSIGNGREVFSTVLQNGENVEVARSVSQLLSRKLQVPAYVYLDGSVGNVYHAIEKIVKAIEESNAA